MKIKKIKYYIKERELSVGDRESWYVMENLDTSSSSDSIPLATVLSKLDEEYAPQQNNTRTSTLNDEDEQIFDESKDATTSSKPQIPIDSSIDTSNDPISPCALTTPFLIASWIHMGMLPLCGLIILSARYLALCKCFRLPAGIHLGQKAF
jgi:hypothetical protein